MIVILKKKSSLLGLAVALVGWISTQPVRADLDDLDSTPAPAPAPSAPRIPGKPADDYRSPDLGSQKPAPSTKPEQSAVKDGAKKPVPASDPGNSPKLPVRWRSGGLVAMREQGVTELTKDVVITQGNTELQADHAKIYFDEAADDVSKVVVTGNVRVLRAAESPRDRMKARGNEATFYNKEQTVTLKGNATLERGGDIIRGKTINYQLETGLITVDNVEGVMQPGESKK